MWRENTSRLGTAQMQSPLIYQESQVPPPTRRVSEPWVTKNRGPRSRSWPEGRGSQRHRESPTPAVSKGGECGGDVPPSARPGAFLFRTREPPPHNPAQGSPGGEPPNSQNSFPRTSVPCTLQPQRHGSQVAAPEPSEAPSPLPWPCEPPPQLLPTPCGWLCRARPAALIGRRVCHS